jgi:EamA domain-containing membrane protein RarD
MTRKEVPLPMMALVAATRVMLGAGAALLLVEQMTGQQRKAVGWTLLGVGVLSTVPLLGYYFGKDE